MRNDTARASGLTYVGRRSVVILLGAVCVTFGALFWGFDRITESADAPVASRANADRAPTAQAPALTPPVALVTPAPLADPPPGFAGSASATAPQWLKAPTSRPNVKPAAATRASRNSATPALAIAAVHVVTVVPVHRATRVPVPARNAVTAAAAAATPVRVASVVPVRPTEPLVMSAHKSALSRLATSPRRQRSEPHSIVSRASSAMHASDRGKTSRARTPKLAHAMTERANKRVPGQNAILVPFAPVTPAANRPLEPGPRLRESLLVATPNFPAPVSSVVPAP